MPKRYPGFLLLLVLLFLAACSQDPATPTLQATATEEEIAQEAAPTETPQPSATATEAPTETATPEPTATVTPTATPTPLLLLSPEDFGEERNPLTGELVEEPENLQRRPIAFKISNSPAEFVRPQSGLGQADIVFEHATEGPITRFTGLIYGQTPPDIGPIRSGRLIDVEIPQMYDAAFAYSGASAGVNFELFNSNFANRILRADAPGFYRTGEDKPFEHTLYADPEEWWEELEDRELNRPPEFSTQMAFGEEPPEGGEPASHININYQDRMVVDWEYDEESGRYWRWADGEEHVDRNTGEQLSAANVVVVFALHQVDLSICEYIPIGGTECQAYSTEIQIWGQGSALIFRDGQMYEATWRREQPDHMLTFYDADDNPIPLQIGNTFMQVVALHYEDPVTVD
ncbi:MAG: DUF3048 domain-containing protein [Chloroflexota bacterium]